jgi:7-carboxy-7-deazaguanine synthase
MLKINEIFVSVDGEVNKWGQGVITTFVRFAGCNLSCNYCDTKHQNFSLMSIEEIESKIETDKVTITGGEPLLQEEWRKLIHRLWNRGKKISIETNGTKFISDTWLVLDNVNWIIDYKYCSPPVNKLQNISESHFVKFVISTRSDFDRALEIKNKIRNERGVIQIAFSAAIPLLTPAILLEWLLIEKEFDVILNVQLHKFIGVK